MWILDTKAMADKIKLRHRATFNMVDSTLFNLMKLCVLYYTLNIITLDSCKNVYIFSKFTKLYILNNYTLL